MFLGQNHPRKNKRSSNTTEHRCVLVRRHKPEQETPETQGVPWVPDTWPSARGRGRVDRGRNRRLVIAPPAVRNFSDGRASRSRQEPAPACFSIPCPVRTRTRRMRRDARKQPLRRGLMPDPRAVWGLCADRQRQAQAHVRTPARLQLRWRTRHKASASAQSRIYTARSMTRGRSVV